MSKIDRIIKNLETIKSRDSANHKENCNCELCESIKIANNQKNLIKVFDKHVNRLDDICKTYNEQLLITTMKLMILFFGD